MPLCNMGKIIWFVTVSLDGYFEGLNHDISWHNVDDEFNRFAIKQLRETDALLFGRRTYQLFEDFWPKAADDPSISKENLEIASLINNVNKIVFSKTLKKVEESENWRNVRLVSEINRQEIEAMKRQSGKNLSVGGSNLCVSFAEMGLIDEFQIMVNPVAIGAGNSLFKGIKRRLKLRLLETRTFKSGNVLLCYEPVKQ